jgi:hypothetical protein
MGLGGKVEHPGMPVRFWFLVNLWVLYLMGVTLSVFLYS